MGPRPFFALAMFALFTTSATSEGDDVDAELARTRAQVSVWKTSPELLFFFPDDIFKIPPFGPRTDVFPTHPDTARIPTSTCCP